MVGRQRGTAAAGHVPEEPLALDVFDGSSQEQIGNDGPRRLVVVSDIVALEIQPGFVIRFDIDLDLERGNERVAAVCE